ncbi:MAG TPA: redoxin domain-containing protein [Bryobacteraceae bacterium]|nr:redoxin domain-containing protein [Bryobacteraceae bacterium]
MLKAGAKAPAFTLDDLTGGKQTLSGVLSRGPALLALYKISCPVCQMTLPFLDRIAKGALQVIAISQDEDSGTTRFQKTYGVSVPTLLDREREGYPVSNAFGISHVPSLFLIEPDGTISLSSEGFIKRDIEAIAQRSGVAPFRPEEKIPEWKAG